MKRIAAAITTALMSFTAHGAEGFICIADAATGFRFSNERNKWESVNFRTDHLKYVLTKDGGKWLWKSLGSSYGEKCQEFTEGGWIRCDEIHIVTFNRNSLRFQAIYPFGYVTSGKGPDTSKDTPGIEIGRCSPL